MVAGKMLKCPYCKCVFVSGVDLERHLSAIHWREGRSGWEWMPIEEAPDLGLKLKSTGEFVEGGYIYRLSGDKRTIFRRRVHHG
jgi:hypothetical protein